MEFRVWKLDYGVYNMEEKVVYKNIDFKKNIQNLKFKV